MTRKRGDFRRLWVLVFLPLLLLLGGCDLPSDEACTESELTTVVDTAPHDTVVNSLTPVMTWRYPDDTCQPELYHIEIYDEDIIGPTFDPSLRPEPIHIGQSEGTYYSVPASASLQPGTSYTWSVSARTAANRGRGGSVIDWFTTGPRCPAGTAMLAPILTYPPDGVEMYFPESVKLHWDNQLSCWPAGDTYLQISKRADFRDPVWYGAVAHEFIWIQDTPPTFENCTRYYWRVRADPAGGGEGPYSETRSFILRRDTAVCLVAMPPVVSSPFAHLKSDATCRSGPTSEYPILDYLTAGQELDIVGRNRAGDSWLVDNPNIGRSCWIFGERVEAIGSIDQVQIANPDPPPTATPEPTLPGPPPQVDCSQYNSNTCYSNPACTWLNGACVNK